MFSAEHPRGRGFENKPAVIKVPSVWCLYDDAYCYEAGFIKQQLVWLVSSIWVRALRMKAVFDS